MFSSSISAGSGYISTDMIMEFSTLKQKQQKILNEILNSFEANKYVNTFIQNKKKYVKCIKISCKSCQCLLTSTSEPWFLKRDNNLKP